MNPSRRGRVASALCVVILATLPFALFWRVTLGWEVFAEGDLFTYNYPLLSTIAGQWRAGELPLWNPYLFGGTPLHANMQGGAFYPPNAILLVLPTWLAYQYSILLHYSLAGVFMFLFLRAIPTCRHAALLGALTFALGGFGMGHLGHVSTVRTMPWLPLLLYGFENWRRSLDRRYAVLAATAIGFMLVAGHPQVPLYALLVGAGYASWCVRVARGNRLRISGGFLASALLGVGLAAVQLLPTAQLARSEYLRPDGRSYAYFVNYSLHPALLVNLVFPRLVPVNEAELAVYVGLATLVLAIVAAWHPTAERRALVRFFVGLTLVALLLAFGGWIPLAHLLFHVPLYNLFTCPARNLFEFDFAIAALAALGAQRLSEPTETAGTRRKAVAVFVSLVLLTAGLIAVMRLLRAPFPAEVASLAEVPVDHPSIVDRLGVLILTCALLCWHPQGRRARLAAGVLLVPLLLADLGGHAQGIYRQSPASIYTAPPQVLGFLKAQARVGRILTLGTLDGAEVETKALLGADVNAAYGIESINGFDSLMLRQIDEASGHVMPTYGLILGSDAYNDPQFERFMDLLNARYIVTPTRQTMELAAPRYRSVYDDGETRVFENTQALPRLLIVPCVRAMTRLRVLDVLASGHLGGAPFDPRGVALVELPADAANEERELACTPGSADPRGGDVRVLENRPGLLRIIVDSPSQGMLIHSSNYSEGWKAVVDGAAAPVCRVDGLVQGVRLSQGRHEVTLAYRPGAFVLGAGVSLLSALVVAWLLGRPRLAREASS